MISKILFAFLIVLCVVGGGYYYITEQKIAKLELTLDNERKINQAFELREQEQKKTIETLQGDFQRTTQALQNQTKRSQEIQAEMNRYLDIFKRHDLSKLAAAKPGLIEKRINKGTKDVFESIENDSRVVSGDSK